MTRRRTSSIREVPVARTTGSGPAGVGPLADNYWARSMRPLHILVFLLPLLVAYEVGSILYLADPHAGIQRTIDAQQVMRDFFKLLGVAGSLMPGIAMGAVLLVWHLIRRDPWVIDARTLGGMLAESAAWTLPLIVLTATVQHATATLSAMSPGLQAHTGGLVALVHESTRLLLGLPVPSRLTIAIGAGLYEEMLFRLIGLALIHFILADLIGVPNRWATVGAILLSAVAFAAYHHPDQPGAWATYILSGTYLGTVYAMRGFGIVVGTHALYDVLVLAVAPAISG